MDWLWYFMGLLSNTISSVDHNSTGVVPIRFCYQLYQWCCWIVKIACNLKTIGFKGVYTSFHHDGKNTNWWEIVLSIDRHVVLNFLRPPISSLRKISLNPPTYQQTEICTDIKEEFEQIYIKSKCLS